MRPVDEIQRAWDEHGDAPEAVAARLPGLIDRAMPGEGGKISALVLRVVGEQLGRFADGLALMERLVEHGRVMTDGGSSGSDGEAVDRGLAVFRLCTGDQAGFEQVLGQLGFRRASQEALVLALAATAVGSHGRTEEATEWLIKASNTSYKLADGDPAVKAVAVASCTLVDALLARTDRTESENTLLRSGAGFARVAWDRAGTWLELQQAEYRQAACHVALGEPIGAVAHAEACLAVCQGNGAGPDELTFAHEIVSRARFAAGDSKRAALARERAVEEARQVSAGIRPRVDAALAQLTALF